MHLNRLKRARAAAALGAVLAAALVLGVVGLTTAAAQEPDETVAEVAASRPQPTDTMTTILSPGDNLVGWLKGKTPVAELFEAVPEIETVWAWDVLRRQWLAASRHVPAQLHTLRQLTPGMGLLVQVDADEPVEWTRSAYPAAGLVKLHEGPNLVAWLGRDESPITYLALGIGASFEGAEIWDAANAQYLSHDPSNNETDGGLSAIRRGDAVWVNVSRTVNWLQPTGVLPTVLLGDRIPKDRHAAVMAQVEDVVDFFASEYGIEADHSLLTVEIETREKGGAWGGARRIYVGTDPVLYSQPQVVGVHYALPHEYFHVVQDQLIDNFASRVFYPRWIVEGTAEHSARMSWDKRDPASAPRFFRGLDGVDPGRDFASAQQPPSGDPYTAKMLLGVSPYRVGELAVRWLVSYAGEASLVEFFRQLAPIPSGPDYSHWQLRSSWEGVFQNVFGISTDRFYVEFDDWRREIAGDSATANGEPKGRLIQGSVVDANGVAMPGVGVGLKGLKNDLPLAETDQNGQFTLTLSADSGQQDAILRIVPNDAGCGLYYGSSGLATWSSDVSPIELRSNVTNVQIRMPSEQYCQWIRGRLVSETGVGLARVMIRDNESWSYVTTAEDGSFAYSTSRSSPPPWSSHPWSFRLALLDDDDACTVSVHGSWNDGIPTPQSGGLRVDVTDDGELRIEVPAYACAREISGRIVDSDGVGLAANTSYTSVAVYALNPHLGRRWPRADMAPDGSFSTIVPLDGEYYLRVYLQSAGNSSGEGCLLYAADGGRVATSVSDASLILVDGSDVSDVVIRLPDNPCG